MIIGIAGYKSSGKDTAGSVLVDTYGWEKNEFCITNKRFNSKYIWFKIDLC